MYAILSRIKTLEWFGANVSGSTDLQFAWLFAAENDACVRCRAGEIHGQFGRAKAAQTFPVDPSYHYTRNQGF